jgi:hypothetical protein
MMAVKEAHNATEILISKALTHLLECGAEITHDTLILTLDDKRKNLSDPDLRMDYCRAIGDR